jgi:hypothetical protein
MMIRLSRIQTQLSNTNSKSNFTPLDFDNVEREKHLINHIRKIVHSLIACFSQRSFLQFPGASECFCSDNYEISGTADEVWVMDMINNSSKSENDPFDDKSITYHREKLRIDSLLFSHILINKKILATTVINDDVIISVRCACFSKEGSSFRISLLQNLTRSVGIWRAIHLMSSNSIHLSDQDGKDISSDMINNNGSNNEGDRCDIMMMRKDKWELMGEQQQGILKQQSFFCASSQSSELFSTRIEVLNPFQIFGLNYITNESKEVLSMLKDCDELYSTKVISIAEVDCQIKKWEIFGVQKGNESIKNDGNKENLCAVKNLVWYNDIMSSLGGFHGVNAEHVDGGNDSSITYHNKGSYINSMQSPNMMNDINIKSVEKDIMTNLKSHWRRWLQQTIAAKDNQNLERKNNIEKSSRSSEFCAGGTQIDVVHDAMVNIIAVISSCLCDYDCTECGWRTGVSGVGFSNEHRLKGRIDTVKELIRELSISWFFQISDSSEQHPPSLLLFQGSFHNFLLCMILLYIRNLIMCYSFNVLF